MGQTRVVVRRALHLHWYVRELLQMIDLFVGYGLLILYTFFVLLASIALFLMIILGISIYVHEDHTVDADWRPVAVFLVVVGCVSQWFLLTRADTIIKMMWHSLPPLPFFG